MTSVDKAMLQLLLLQIGNDERDGESREDTFIVGTERSVMQQTQRIFGTQKKIQNEKDSTYHFDKNCTAHDKNAKPMYK